MNPHEKQRCPGTRIGAKIIARAMKIERMARARGQQLLADTRRMEEAAREQEERPEFEAMAIQEPFPDCEESLIRDVYEHESRSKMQERRFSNE
ncbi:MAG: hypothetical protein JRJ03_08765 [Deltaproteobacteria bacterium]|nr:hypothetical protein [Deltaproteobacteria bacterium]